MILLPPRSTPLYSSAASDVYKRQETLTVTRVRMRTNQEKIRDRHTAVSREPNRPCSSRPSRPSTNHAALSDRRESHRQHFRGGCPEGPRNVARGNRSGPPDCLLYTSDAADE